MIIINRGKGDNIDKMIKRYRSKTKKIKLHKELKNRKHYTKPSVKRRSVINDAIYRNSKLDI